MAGGFLDIVFTVDGLVEIQRSFVSWGKAVQDLSPVWKDIGAELRQDNALNFAEEGLLFGFSATQARYGAGERGAEWPALADSTVRERERLGYGGEGPILVRTGELLESLTVEGASGNITRIGPVSAEFGSAHPLAGYHHWGTRRIPERPIVGLTRDRQQDIVYRLGTYVREQARAAGLDAS